MRKVLRSRVTKTSRSGAERVTQMSHLEVHGKVHGVGRPHAEGVKKGVVAGDVQQRHAHHRVQPGDS
eukprot:923683-Prorocentrum_minimum.AAC.1